MCVPRKAASGNKRRDDEYRADDLLSPNRASATYSQRPRAFGACSAGSGCRHVFCSTPACCRERNRVVALYLTKPRGQTGSRRSSLWAPNGKPTALPSFGSAADGKDVSTKGIPSARSLFPLQSTSASAVINRGAGRHHQKVIFLSSAGQREPTSSISFGSLSPDARGGFGLARFAAALCFHQSLPDPPRDSPFLDAAATGW